METDTQTDTVDTGTPTNDEPAQISQAEWDEVLTFVREMRPLVDQLAALGGQLKGGGLAGIAAALIRS